VVSQGTTVVLRLLASFHVDELGCEYQRSDLVDAVPPPEDLPEQSSSVHRDTFDVRALGLGPTDGVYWRTPHRFWARARGPLPTEPFLGECVLAYLSDVGTGLAKLPDPLTGHGPSLDHAVWFHRTPDVEDWVFVDLTPVSASGARGFSTGTMQDRAGNLVATIAQEQLARDLAPR
jgi:acyl-CoA thioesterase-2